MSAISSCCDSQDICDPQDTLAEDVPVVTHELSWFSFLERFARLAVFKYGIFSFSTCYQRFFLRRFQSYFAGYGYCGCQGYFDEKRAQGMINTWKILGAEIREVVPEDGEACLQTMRIKASTLKDKIENLGGCWKKVDEKIVIYPPKEKSSQWDTFYVHLKRIFPSEIQLEAGETVLQTGTCTNNAPFETHSGKVVLFSSFASHFVMKKSSIAFFFGRGIDVCFYDGRGLFKSIGYPSEQGSYFDIEGVFESLRRDGYAPKSVVVYASCGESFPSMHLFKKYYKQGINLLLVQSPLSLESALERVNRFALWLLGFAKKAIRAPAHSNCAKIPSDGFNSAQKLVSLAPLEKKKERVQCLLIGTEDDKMAPFDEVEQMGEMLKEKNIPVTVLRNNPRECSKKPKTDDPHRAKPLSNDKIANQIMKFIDGVESQEDISEILWAFFRGDCPSLFR